MTREEIIHIFENSRLVSEHFDSEAVTAAYIEGLAALREQEERRWISVSEQMPEEKANCIVHYKHAYCDNDDYWAIGMCFYDGEKFQLGPAYKVTHWMPLPKPPKEE